MKQTKRSGVLPNGKTHQQGSLAGHTATIPEVGTQEGEYDVPDGIQGLPLLNGDCMHIHTTHDIKLPAEYDEVAESHAPNDGYYMLDEANMSPTHNHSYESFVDDDLPSFPLAAGQNGRPAISSRAKTLVTSSSENYETPFDAQIQMKSKTAPSNIYSDYETPHDATL